MQPAVGERLRRGFRVAPVAAHNGRSAHQDLADFACGQRQVAGAGDAHVDARLRATDRHDARIVTARHRVGEQRAVHCGNGHRRLALAVDLREARPERHECGLAVFAVHRPAAIDDAFQMVEPHPRQLRRVDQALHHRRRREEERALPHVDEVHDFRRVETARGGDDADRAARDVRNQVEARAVRQRRRMQDGVAGFDALDVREKALRHREQVAVRDLDALGPARRAARVEEPRRIVRCHRQRFGERLVHHQPVVIVTVEADRGCSAAFHRCQRVLPRIIDKGRTRAAVREHEREFLRVQFRVDRHRDQPGPPAREQRFDVLRGVARNERDTVAGLQPRGPHARGQTGGTHGKCGVVVQDPIANRDRRQVRPVPRSAHEQAREITGHTGHVSAFAAARP